MSGSVQFLFDRYGPAYRWIATVTVMTGAIAVVLSSTIVNVAVPDVMGTFGVGLDQAQWLATAFLAAMTISQLLSAWLLDMFGARVTLVATLSLFSSGALLGAFAPNMEVLALARTLQGIAAGTVMPVAMVVIALVFPPDRKGTAMGILSMGIVLAPSIGPVVGGIAIDTYSWRYIFFIPLPMCVVALVLSALFMPRRDPTIPYRRFDFIGLSLLATAVTCLLIGLAGGQRFGWGSNYILTLLASGGVASALFVYSQLRSPAPLLDFNVLKNQRFAFAVIIAFVFGAGLFATTYYIPVFVQTVMNYTATNAGLLLAPGGIILMIIFPLAGRLADSVPEHYLIAGGLIVLSYGFYLLADADVNTTFLSLVVMTLVGRIGLGFINPPLNAVALRALPSTHLARGSSTINFFRQLGGAFGVSALVIAVELRTQMHSAAFTDTQTADNATSQALLSELAMLLREAGIPDTLQFPSALSYLGRVIQAQATSLAFQDAALLIAATFAITVIPACLLGLRPRAVHL
ncbi:MAG: DHA2 family efflux MFS transporter permease subunit [Pseudomonadota bacterium]